MIGQRREELASQTGVTELNLDTVKAPFTDMNGAPMKKAGDLLDIFRLHLLGRFTKENIRHRTRRPDRQTGDHAVALLAVMIDLGKDLGIVLMYVIGYLLKSGEHLGVIDIDQFLVSPVGRMNAHLLRNDQSCTPFGAFTPVVHMPLAREAVDRKVSQVRLKRYAVFNIDRTDLEW